MWYKFPCVFLFERIIVQGLRWSASHIAGLDQLRRSSFEVLKKYRTTFDSAQVDVAFVWLWESPKGDTTHREITIHSCWPLMFRVTVRRILMMPGNWGWDFGADFRIFHPRKPCNLCPTYSMGCWATDGWIINYTKVYKLTWNPKMEVWKMIFLVNCVIFRWTGEPCLFFPETKLTGWEWWMNTNQPVPFPSKSARLRVTSPFWRRIIQLTRGGWNTAGNRNKKSCRMHRD